MFTGQALQKSLEAHGSLNILLAEDNEVNQKLARRLLEKRGHLVVAAANGREALQAMRGTSFDLVLMDVQMPEMDGIEATAVLRSSEKVTGGHQPVIAMTALVMKGDRERCLEAGMDGYLSKPIRAQELDEVLDKYLALKYQKMAMSDAAGEKPEAAEPGAVDELDLMQRVEEDREFLAELVDLFRAEAPKQMNRLRTALEQKDSDEARRATHSLRGVLSNLSARTAANLTAEIENAAGAGDFARADAAMQQFEPELTRVIAALSAICEEAKP
jgi:CheY-like chemotaxis protein